MTLIDKIDMIRRGIRKHTIEINKCTRTAAGVILRQELTEDRNELYGMLGRLISNSEVLICLR